MRRWLKLLTKDPDALADWLADMATRVAIEQRAVEDAPTWEAVLEARGRKKALDELAKFANMQLREEHANGRRAAR